VNEVAVTPEEFLSRPDQQMIDDLEARLIQFPQVDLKVVHRFTPGLYIRETHAPAGMIFTSKIHLKEHPFVIAKGVCHVWMDGSGWVRQVAPFVGITKPLTRRVVFTEEDTVCITFHPTTKTTLEEVEAEIIFSHYEHLGLSDEGLTALRKIQHFTNSENLSLEG